MYTLWLDIGNSRVKFWLTPSNNPSQVIRHDAIDHNDYTKHTVNAINKQIYGYQAQHIYISSVLSLNKNIEFTLDLGDLTRDMSWAKVSPSYMGLTTEYDATKLGVDRWLQLLAINHLYKNYIIIGCGTALTLDVVSEGLHLGGYIVPSPYLQREALYNGTHRVKVHAGTFDKTALGLTTDEAVNNGVSQMTSAFVQSVTTQYPQHQVILTGGDAADMQMLLPATLQTVTEQGLVFKGLKRYFEIEK